MYLVQHDHADKHRVVRRCETDERSHVQIDVAAAFGDLGRSCLAGDTITFNIGLDPGSVDDNGTHHLSEISRRLFRKHTANRLGFNHPNRFPVRAIPDLADEIRTIKRTTRSAN